MDKVVLPDKPRLPIPARENPHDGFRRCVGIVLVNAQGGVFAGHRVGLTHGWQMPQGGIDPGESAEQAAFRELEEETGVPADSAEILQQSGAWYAYALPTDLANDTWRGRFKGQTQRWFLMRFTGPDSLVDLNRHHPEFDNWQWLDAETVCARIIAFKRPVYQAVFAEFHKRMAALTSSDGE